MSQGRGRARVLRAGAIVGVLVLGLVAIEAASGFSAQAGSKKWRRPPVASPSPSPSPTATATASPTPTSTATATPAPAPAPTATSTASPSPAPVPAASLVPSSGAWFGAYVDPDNTWSGNTAAEQEVTTFESQVGRKLAINQHYYGWSQTFPSGLEQWDIAGGRIPLISWMGTSLTSVSGGSYDAMIAARADGLKALGKPVFLRFAWEMNGDWYAWDGSHNNSSGLYDGPAKYVAAWRHVHDIFVARGATNVVWVWAPNHESVPNTSWNNWRNYYPGDGYVDWVGIDGYNWGTTRTWSSWKSFGTLFTPVYSDYAARKPVMISEVSSVEAGGSKASWITGTRTSISSSFPAIKAVVWFDVLKEEDWRATSSATALDAYRAMGADPYFAP